ncbi:uncharacterized protein K452DRAFT_198146, partial [Aplosporella prunicola CBS 121167]
RSRKAAHIPRTADTQVYVLTLSTSPSLSEPLDALRKKYFPARLNFTPAHLTMFHALPASELPSITAKIEELCAATQPFTMRTGAPFRLRRGVGIGVAEGAAEAKKVHYELQSAWKGFLSEQDRQKWHLHWTVQNKVTEERKVWETFEEVEGFEGAEGEARGCTLWRYEGGNWGFERDFEF